MYWVFADSQHLTEVIASQTLPAEIVNSEVHFARSSAGEVWVEPMVSIPRALARELKEQGVRSQRKKPSSLKSQTAEEWWQILPPDRLPANGKSEDGQFVILQISFAEDVSRTMQEILRLGGRLQSIHIPWEPYEPVHLLVWGLPYFSKLAARDPMFSRGQRLYVFHDLQVAIEAGFSHALVDFIEVPRDHILLLDGTGEIQLLGPSGMRTVSERRILSVPPNELAPFARTQIETIPVPLRLISRPTPEPPSLWVILPSELEAWVRGAEQRLVEQLAVTIIDSSESPRVVVRALNENTPPVLLWESGSFCPSDTVSGLYLPWNRRLHPAVRSDVLQTVLNCHRETVTWISEDTSNPLRVQRVSRSAFRPLVDWVDYELPQVMEHIQPWSPQLSWDFEPFLILEEPRKSSDRSLQESSPREEPATPRREVVSRASGTRKTAKPTVARPRVSQPMQRNHREARKRLAELQKRFRSVGLPLDAEDHYSAWQEMASLHFLLHEGEEGMLCLSHALWNDNPPDVMWLQSLWNTGPGKERGNTPVGELEQLLRVRQPTGEELSRLAFLLVWLSVGEMAEAFPRERIAELQEFLMRFEHELPVRVGWLAWVSLINLLGGDALTLARARDRYLERLFARGIRPERDVPHFLRSGGLESGTGWAGLRLQLSSFRDVLHAWSRTNGKNTSNQTQAYLDLVLAFGLARRGETVPAKQLLESAGKLLRRTRDPFHQWCLEAFAHRVQQVLSGGNPTLPLPRPLSEAFQAFSKHDQFKLNRLRQESQILEPPQTRDLYRAYRKDCQDALERELADLEDIADSIELATRYERLQKTHQHAEAKLRLAVAGLEWAPRMGGTMAEQLLAQSARLLTNDCEATLRVQLLEKSLRVAAHFDREEWVARFVSDLDLFLDSLRDAAPETAFSLESLAGESFQGMRRFGLRAEMIRLLDRMEQFHQETSATDSIKGQLLSLRIAGGRFFFEQNEHAWPVLDRVREVLLSEQLSAIAQTQLARAYLKALEFAPADKASERFWDFFQNVRGISDGFSLNTLLFVSQLSVVEAFLFAMTGEVNQKDPATRKLLDDEEYCVRRRIHRDLQEAMKLH